MATTKKISPSAKALQLNVEGLFKLLGGTPDERLRFWEILKGITTPAEFQLVNNQIKSLQGLVNQVETNVVALKKTAAKIERQ